MIYEQAKISFLKNLKRMCAKKSKKNTMMLIFAPKYAGGNQQSFCIKVGNAFEELINEMVSNSNSCTQLISVLEKRKGKKVLIGNPKNHQIDLLFLKNDTIYCREIKTNLNLDSGKKRDTKITRNVEIEIILKEKFNDCKIDIGIFCPILEKDKKNNSLGLVNGWEWLKNTIESDITYEQLLSLGACDEFDEIAKKYI